MKLILPLSLMLMILHFYHLLSPLLPLVINSFLPVHSMPALVCQLLYLTTVLFTILYCKIIFFFFFVFVFMYYLYEEYCKPTTVQYYIASCINWVLRLTLGEGDGTPLQYSCLENRMDGGAW